MTRKWRLSPSSSLCRWVVAAIVICGAAIVAVSNIYSSGISCEAYQRAVHAASGPGFIPNDDCFFKNMAGVGNYSVGGINFSVPREYLWLGRTRDDGPVDSIYLLFHAPDMSSASSYGEQEGNMIIEVFHCKRDKCVLNPSFADRARERRCVESSSGIVIWPPGFKKISGDVDDYYYLGSICSPDEVMVCDGNNVVGVNPRCEYIFELSNNVYVKIGFRKRDVFGKTHLMRGAIEKLMGFASGITETKSGIWGKK